VPKVSSASLVAVHTIHLQVLRTRSVRVLKLPLLVWRMMGRKMQFFWISRRGQSAQGGQELLPSAQVVQVVVAAAHTHQNAISRSTTSAANQKDRTSLLFVRKIKVMDTQMEFRTALIHLKRAASVLHGSNLRTTHTSVTNMTQTPAFGPLIPRLAEQLMDPRRHSAMVCTQILLLVPSQMRAIWLSFDGTLSDSTS